jgi:hypothetical protein
MSTILIVLLVLFLVGGGGWGYSRWRGYRDHRMNASLYPVLILLPRIHDEGSTRANTKPASPLQVS